MRIFSGPAAARRVEQLASRGSQLADLEPQVRKIVEDVRERGDRALRRYAQKWDGLTRTSELRLTPAELEAAWTMAPPRLRAALRQAAANIRRFCQWQRPLEWKRRTNGMTLGQVIRPIGSVGCYVPGGRHPLVSTLLMTVIPAQVAGVKQIRVVSPRPAQATLAADYFDLRAEDSLEALLRETVAAYRRALVIAQNQYRAGTQSSIDLVTAQAQLESTEAQLAGVGVQRQQYEHAIAMLTGHAPSELSIPPAELTSVVPVAPAGLPSALLERRPDIAAAERLMQEQNALIGVQIAAYYPTISLSALGGLQADSLSRLFNVASRVWSLGATGAEVLFSGGARPAAVAAAHASYDQYVAVYRQTVLTAFQQVEDALSNLRILEQQAAKQAIAMTSARRAVEATLNAYRAGTVAYTSVITEQTLLLSDEQSALSVRQSRLVASVALIEALGGGWSADTLPSPASVKRANPVFP